MKVKNMRRVDCKAGFQVKKAGGDTFIQGYANAAVVDRGKDFIKTDAWNLDNYKKVPTILFNHDKDKPIGKAVDIRPTEQGLWVKAKISNSPDPEISKIRDLINEGMLNAFSVGFDSQQEQKNAEGVNDISQAELFEISVVTLPMNQDSVFEMSAKMLKTLSVDECRSEILKAKGAWLAEAVHGKIYELEKSGSENRSAILAKIVNASQASADDLTKVLAGETTPVPENILSAFSEVLGLDLEELKTLDAGDADLKTKADTKAMPPEDDCADQPGKKGQPSVVSLRIPKGDLAEQSQVIDLVKAAGYDMRGITEEGGDWVVLVADPAAFGDAVEMDMGDGTFAMVAFPKAQEQAVPDEDPTEELEPKAAVPPKKPEDDKPVADPNPGDQPPPADDKPPMDSEPPKEPGDKPVDNPPAPDDAPPADAPPADDAPESDAPSEGDKPPEDQGQGDLAAEAEAFKKDEQAAMNGEVPSWVADEAKWQQAVEASGTALGKLDYAFAMMWYFQNGGEKKSDSTTREKGIVAGGSADKPIDDNEYLAQARQTNVLLGSLIKEIQALSASLQGTAIAKPPAPPAPEKTIESEAEVLDKEFNENLVKFMDDIDKKLRKNGA